MLLTVSREACIFSKWSYKILPDFKLNSDDTYTKTMTIRRNRV